MMTRGGTVIIVVARDFEEWEGFQHHSSEISDHRKNLSFLFSPLAFPF